MDKIERMGPANIPCVVKPLEEAMPLRDYFAAKAMASLIPPELFHWHPGQTITGNDDRHANHMAQIAKLSYVAADAMLAERDKRP